MQLDKFGSEHMKLSEAMRLGAMATTQGYGADSVRCDDRPCALGAARLAAGLSAVNNVDALVQIRNRFPLATVVVQNLPTGVDCIEGDSRISFDVVDVIWRLNDHHR